MNDRHAGSALEMPKKFLITMSDDLLAIVEKYAKLASVPRSSAICVLCAQALANNNVIDVLPGVVRACRSEQDKCN